MMFTNQLSRGSYSFQRRGRPPKPIVNIAVTLDPNKFAEKKQKRLHIGSLAFFHLYIALHNQSSPVKALPRLYYDWTERGSSFPRDNYSTSSTRPRIAGELRLRVASSDDPASFESGSDLLGLNGRPWSRSLFAVSKFYIPLPVYEILRKEHHVPDDLDAILSTFSPRSIISRNISQRLYSFNDTFTVDFSCIKRCLSVKAWI